MEFKRKINRKQESELQRTINGVRSKHKKSIALVSVIGCMLGAVSVWFGTDCFTNPEVEEAAILNESPFIERHLVVNSDAAVNKDGSVGNTGSGTSGGSIGQLGDADKFGTYPMDYYIVYWGYEGNVYSKPYIDGGWGPLPATHSSLPNLLDGLYEYDQQGFAYLQPYVENPLLYLKRCNGNDRGNHRWPNSSLTSGCVTYTEGSQKIKDVILANHTPGDSMKYLYDSCMIVYEQQTGAMEKCLSTLEQKLGKPRDQIGHGTVATLYAAYIRYGSGNDRSVHCVDGLNPGMSDNEAIDSIDNYLALHCSEDDLFRFKGCQRSVTKGLNNGTIDPWGMWRCDGSCNSAHGPSTENDTWTAMFGGKSE